MSKKFVIMSFVGSVFTLLSVVNVHPASWALFNCPPAPKRK